MIPRVALVTATLALSIAILVGPPAAVSAADHALPGMCSGRREANLVINAQAHDDVKFILNVETDAAGQGAGILILDQGPSRLMMDDICRVWQHQPGQEYGECAPEAGATVVHAVGLGKLADGTRVLVRTDARETEEGSFFRVRHRAVESHHETSVAAYSDGGCSDDDWVRWPAEGWAPLHRLHVRHS